MEWYNTLAIVITAFAAVFGITYWAKAKLLVTEVSEAFVVLREAMADDKITAPEIKKIVKEFMDIMKVFLRK